LTKLSIDKNYQLTKTINDKTINWQKLLIDKNYQLTKTISDRTIN